MRKVGKLPSATIKATYSLEYGTDSLEMHKDAIEPGQRVLIVDDLLATGGTAAATVSLVKQLGGNVEGLAFLIELVELKGRDKLAGEQSPRSCRYRARWPLERMGFESVKCKFRARSSAG